MKPEIFEPSNELAEFVKCYWNLESTKESTPIKNTIVPDGTMKLIFHYGDTYKHHPNKGKSIVLPKFFLIGQLTRPYVVEPIGITGTFVVRFQPNGFLPFTTIQIKKMENTAVPLFDLYGKEGDILGDNILNAKDTTERIKLIEIFLLNQLKKKENRDQFIKSTIETILQTNGYFSVNQHSKEIRVSRRQLTRKFSKTIGLSPKQLAKTVRIQATLKKLLSKEVSKFTDIAYENDYFDQSHFIKDFKEFTGLTPKEFYGDSLKMSLIFDREE